MHVPASEVMRHPRFALQNNGELFIKEIVRPGASSRHLAYSDPATRSVSAAHPSATQSCSVHGSYGGEYIGPRGASDADRRRHLRSCTEEEADLEKELAAKISATIHTLPETQNCHLYWTRNPPTTRIILCAHLTVFLGDRPGTRFHMKLDHGSEGPQPMISCEAYILQITPRATRYVRCQMTRRRFGLAITRSSTYGFL